ncbi:uncharacterized protein LOC121384678 [Gigantopelta aegis]|uniref:uncharacterized protein LOC121384678 n=1 Tax=Gigantopelta aegis TaxID=1735272 RepID=UPI001B88D04F|nr:uncharacterized protein LOC121384678 [Gigantopelta aegis]
MTVVKSCGSDSTCRNVWWQRTKPNPSCSRPAIEHGHLSPGVTCRFCCSGIRCNADVYPKHLVRYKDQPTTIATTTIATTTTTAATTTTTASTTTVTTTAATTARITTKKHHIKIPSASMCLKCEDDPARGIKCDETSQFGVCNKSHPFCMTSYTGTNGSYVIKRGCATEKKCYSSWWMKSRLNGDCLQTDLLNRTSRDRLECHYCCRAPDTTHAFCNRQSGVLLPANIILFNSTVVGHQCEVTGNDIKSNSKSSIQQCGARTPYCLNTVVRRQYGNNTVYKRCASEAECYSKWWDYTRKQHMCMSLSAVGVGILGINCTYCCDSNATDAVCNIHDVPSETLRFQVSTTQVTTATVTHTIKLLTNPVTSTMTTPTSLLTTTMKSVGPQCQVCEDDPSTGKTCSMSDMVTCPDDEPYCKNTYIVSMNNTKRIIKRCASDSDCYIDWWLNTRHNDQCMNNTGAPPVGRHGFVCRFCCKSLTSNVCNIGLIPKNLLQYDIATTAKTTPLTTKTASTSVAATASVSKTTKTNITFATTATSSVSPAGPQCQVCEDDPSTGKTCSMSDMVTCPDDEPYCKNTYIVSMNNTKRIIKRCASDGDCYIDWWLNTRHNDQCMNNTGAPPVGRHGFVCRFCCKSLTSNVCNIGLVPKNLLQYDMATTAKTTPLTTKTASTSVAATAPVSKTTKTNITFATTATSSVSPAGPQCQVCEDDPSTGKTCSMSDMITCPDDEPYCKNTYIVSMYNTKRIIKRCASDSDCYIDWWLNTRNNDHCMNNTGATPVGRHGFVCQFCCKSLTSNVCNIGLVPKNLLQYDMATTAKTTPLETKTSSSHAMTSVLTTAIPHTTAAITSNVTTAAITTNVTTAAITTNVTAAAITTNVTTAAITSNVTTAAITTNVTTAAITTNVTAATKTTLTPVVQCYVCENGCPFLQKRQLCTSGYCLTRVVDDELYTRTIQKRCVDRHECYTKWWLQTSDNDMCLSLMTMGGTPSGVSIQCDYCCQGDDCNKDFFPPQDTLFDPS